MIQQHHLAAMGGGVPGKPVITEARESIPVREDQGCDLAAVNRLYQGKKLGSIEVQATADFKGELDIIQALRNDELFNYPSLVCQISLLRLRGNATVDDGAKWNGWGITQCQPLDFICIVPTAIGGCTSARVQLAFAIPTLQRLRRETKTLGGLRDR